MEKICLLNASGIVSLTEAGANYIKKKYLFTIDNKIWRVIATSITILSGWIISGNWKFGLAVGGLDTILKTFGYFGFERLWNKR